jgi:sugar phosphate isomerase/epimerase
MGRAAAKCRGVARMSKLSISELTTYRWTFEEDVLHFREAGYEAVGVWRQKLAEFGEDKGVELLEESGLKVSNLLWCGGFTGSDGRSFREALEDAQEALTLAQQLRAECLIVYSGARGGHTHNHARRLLRDALKSLLPQAKELGVTLAVEPMHAEAAGDCTFLSCMSEALTLLQTVADPALKLCVDTYHCGLAADWEKQLAEAAPHTAIVHVGDGKPPVDNDQARTRLGEGIVPLREMLAALRSSGFNGYYDVELIGTGLEPNAYPDLLRHCREQFTALTA